MKLLALEAGGVVLGAALYEGGQPVASTFERAPQRQTERLAPLVQGLLAQAGWRAQDLDAVACGIGPGSFTGLRSSLAFGRGLQLGKPGLRLIGVSTLEAWAEAFSPVGAERAWVLLDGRRGQVYRGAYARQGGLWAERQLSALLDLGAAQAPEGETSLGDLQSGPPDSADLALAVGRLALAGRDAGWEPLYLRRSEAEILWDRLHPPQLRPLREADLEELCAIEKLCFPTPWTRAHFSEELKKPDICFWRVLESNGRVAAYGGFWKAVDEAHFTNIAVHPQQQRQGLGRRLLKALLGLAVEQGCTSATLEVRPSNTAAVRLYESEGFSAAAIRPRYYSDDGEDALLLWKRGMGARDEGKA